MSLWEEYLDNYKFSELTEDKYVDTLIIGGGIAGITSLYYLKNSNSVCLVDANRIGTGVSKNTTGKITYLQGVVYSDLIKNINEHVAIKYLESQKYAISLILDIIKKENIKCDLESVKSYVCTNDDKEIYKIKQENEFLEKQNIKVYEEDIPDVKTKYSIAVDDTYVFNPIKYINHLKIMLKNKDIYENTKIINIEYVNNKYYCYTENKKIIADKVIVACHYPFFIFPFMLPLKSHIEKSYIIACKCKENKKYSCVIASNPGFSMRYYQDGKDIYKIYLASSHSTSTKQNDLENFEIVKRMFNIYEEDIYKKWSNVDIITGDKMPYVGEIKPNLYLATGFNTWGMTNGVLSAKILTDKISGKKNKYENLFYLYRNNNYRLKSFFIDFVGTLRSFITSKIKKKWYSCNIKYKKIKGVSVAIYTDKDGNEHIVRTTCPHMRCGLIFNEVEKTWDCPCHSSRFDMDGKCIKGPSKYNIYYKK